jgi:hypothetical protein
VEEEEEEEESDAWPAAVATMFDLRDPPIEPTSSNKLQ